MRFAWAVTLFLTVGGPALAQPSFSCQRARTNVERAICASGILTELDRRLDLYYRYALEASGGDDRERIARQQRLWIQQRNRCEPARLNNCLEGSYLSRLDAIKAEDSLYRGLVLQHTDSAEQFLLAAMQCPPPFEPGFDGSGSAIRYENVRASGKFLSFDQIANSAVMRGNNAHQIITTSNISIELNVIETIQSSDNVVEIICRRPFNCIFSLTNGTHIKNTGTLIHFCDAITAQRAAATLQIMIRQSR